MMMSFVFFSIAVIGYYFIHSFLADERIKGLLQERWIPKVYFRLLFNGLAIVLLIPLVWWYLELPRVLFWGSHMLPRYFGWTLVFAGAYVLFVALKQYNLQAFSGWEQLHQPDGRAEAETLKTSGINGLVRHPLYFGSLLLFWGFFLHQAHLAAFLVTIISTLYIFVGTRLEEKKLLQRFGREYRKYCRKVPMLWPRLSMMFKKLQRTK